MTQFAETHFVRIQGPTFALTVAGAAGPDPTNKQDIGYAYRVADLLPEVPGALAPCFPRQSVRFMALSAALIEAFVVIRSLEGIRRERLQAAGRTLPERPPFKLELGELVGEKILLEVVGQGLFDLVCELGKRVVPMLAQAEDPSETMKEAAVELTNAMIGRSLETGLVSFVEISSREARKKTEKKAEGGRNRIDPSRN